MRLKFYFIMLVFISFYKLSGEQAISDSLDINPLSSHNAFLLKYNNNFHSTNRISSGTALAFSRNILTEIDILQYVWINKDPFNKNKRNVSIFPVFDLGIGSLISFLNPCSDLWLFPVMITNSSHNLFLNGNPDYTSGKEKVGFNSAFFIKNNTSLYVFWKNNWLDVAPGVGVKLYYRRFALDFGYERRYQFVEHKKPHIEDGFFFSITGYISHLE